MKREITKISVENSDGVFHFSGKLHFWLDGEKDLEDFKEGLVDFLKIYYDTSSVFEMGSEKVFISSRDETENQEHKKVISIYRKKLDDIENILMNTEVLQGGMEQEVKRSSEGKLQKIWDVLYEN